MTERLSDLKDLFNEISIDQIGVNVSFPEIVRKDDIDLSGFIEQNSSYRGVEKEYVNQSPRGEHGLIAVPFNDYFIVFGYCK